MLKIYLPSVAVFGDKTFKEVIKMNEVLWWSPNLIGVFIRRENRDAYKHRGKAMQKI